MTWIRRWAHARAVVGVALAIAAPVKALVLWLPGGEANRIAPPERWTPIPNR